MSVPGRIAIGCGVRMRKLNHGGVSFCRLPASAKNANVSSSGRATNSRVLSLYWAIVAKTPSNGLAVHAPVTGVNS